MIRLQIIEKDQASLFEQMKTDMRTGSLRTFQLHNRGQRVKHKRYHGWMKWASKNGVLDCEIRSPHRLEDESRFLGALIGRLSARYKDKVHSINIRFPER